ncbi:MAG: helix-turn-helix domain-containing protein [Pseudonocardiaceae bacterium]
MNETWLDGAGIKVTSVDCPGATPREVEGGDTFELFLVRKGCFRVRGSELEVFADPTACLIVRPGHAVEVSHPQPGGDVSTFLSLGEDMVASIGGGCTHVPAMVPATAQIAWVHQQMMAAGQWGEDPMAVEELALLLFASALAYAEPGRVRAGRPTGRAHQQLADDARAALIADPTLSSVVELARLLGCSPHHLSRVFTEQTGLGVARYRTALRVDRALNLLGEGETSLTKVAQACGFADHAHLTRTLRRHLGATPSALRAALRTPKLSTGIQGVPPLDSTH